MSHVKTHTKCAVKRAAQNKTPEGLRETETVHRDAQAKEPSQDDGLASYTVGDSTPLQYGHRLGQKEKGLLISKC